MMSAHKHLKISGKDFTAGLEVLQATIKEMGVPDRLNNEIIAIAETLRKIIVVR